MKKTRMEKGITLIALIITIVVLLILAAVAISSITNDGILGYAENAAKDYNQAVEDEQGTLQEYEGTLSGFVSGWTEYNIGDEVTVKGESFYVIKNTDEKESKVLLLAKECIITNKNNANYLTQSLSATEDVFSDEWYWPETGAVDIVETLPIPESHCAAYAAYKYGEKIGGTGRLMTLAEVNELTEEGTIAFPFLSSLQFWVSHAESSGVSYVTTNGEITSTDYDYGGGTAAGVRPVVEISKSKVTSVTE